MQTATVPGRAAATATLATSLRRAERTYKLTSVEYAPAADVTGAATNSLTLELRNRGPDDSINVVLASLALVAGVNASRSFAKAITLIATNGTPTVLEGDRLEWSSVKVGSGLLDPGGTVLVNGTPV
jgi:hypothetical protein